MAIPDALSRLTNFSLEGSATKVQLMELGGSKSWYLPQALSSHFSPFFKATLQDMADARSKASIELHEFEPSAFATFVQWMYYGTYNSQYSFLRPDEIHHIDAWVLGDKLEVPVFQDLAMSHIFLLQTDPENHRSLTTHTVLHVCTKTATNSPLRLLYLDVLAQNFADQARVKGTLEEWDVALQEYPDTRLSLLGSFRAQGSRVKSKEDYLVANGRLSSS